MAEDATARLLAELLTKASAGDDVALNTLCGELGPPIRKYFWRRFQNPDVVEELCQETFIRFLKNSGVLLAAKDRGRNYFPFLDGRNV